MAQRKNLKWRVHDALMDSTLPPAQRLLMFVFSDLANADTGVIPDERKDRTTIKELARQTGLDPATVKRNKPALIALGWISFKRPSWKQQSNHETGTYTIAIGRNPEAHGAPSGKSRKSRTKSDPEAQDAPPVTPDPEAHGAPSPEAHGAPPDGGDKGGPGAHGAPADGAWCATGEAHGAPPINRTTDTDNYTDSTYVPDADASAPESAPKKRVRKKANTDDPRPDVDKLCFRFVELLVENECRKPEITKEWRDAARLMLDKDGRQLDKAIALLEWTQHHSWWKSRVMSMPKFRIQYDALRMQAVEEWERGHKSSGHQPYQNPIDQSGYDGEIR